MKMMRSKQNILFEQLFVILVLFFVPIVPEIQFGFVVDSFNGGMYLSWLFSLLLIVYTRKLANKYIISSALLFVVFSFSMLFFYNELRDLYESRFPALWFDMYHSKIDYFYNTDKNAIFYLLTIILNTCLLVSGKSIGNGTFFNNKKNIYIILIPLVLNLILSIIQVNFQSHDRASGFLSNAQILSSYALLCFIIISNFNVKSVTIVCFAIVFVLILYSGTRSSLLALVAIISMYFFKVKWLRLAVFFLLIVTFIISVILPMFDFDKILSIISIYTSSYTINQRFILWEAFANEIFSDIPSLVIGMRGVIPKFSENIYWYYLAPYGFIGLGFASYLMKDLFSYDRIKLIFLAYILIQGLTFYGFLNSSLGVFFWFGLGLLTSRKTRMDLKYA